jgi:ribosomal protein S18 acetylase RimI-like enzyme
MFCSESVEAGCGISLSLSCECLPMLSTRPASESDVAFLTSVFLRAMRVHIRAARGSWDEVKERSQFQEQLRLHETWIVERGGIDVGFFIAVPRGQDIELHTLCIAPEYQQQGTGTAITRQIIEEARARMCGVVLSVLKTNIAARSLYERLGFVVTEELPYHYRMRLVLHA